MPHAAAAEPCAPHDTPCDDEVRARLALVFERLPKLLDEPSKVKKCKLRKQFPNFTRVATAVVDCYLADCGPVGLDALLQVLPASHSCMPPARCVPPNEVVAEAAVSSFARPGPSYGGPVHTACLPAGHIRPDLKMRL